MNKFTVFTDGGARGNPGPAAVGIVIKSENGEIIQEICRKIGEATNNVAEYQAVVEALCWFRGNKNLIGRQESLSIRFFLDSTLVVNQLNGLFKIKDAKLRNFLLQVRQMEQEIGGSISYAYVPREKNFLADALVNQALDAS